MKNLFAILSWSLSNIWKIISVLVGIIFLYVLISIALPIISFFHFFAEFFSSFEAIINNFFKEFDKYEWYKNNIDNDDDRA